VRVAALNSGAGEVILKVEAEAMVAVGNTRWHRRIAAENQTITPSY
jgi:hypothetical protein